MKKFEFEIKKEIPVFEKMFVFPFFQNYAIALIDDNSNLFNSLQGLERKLKELEKKTIKTSDVDYERHIKEIDRVTKEIEKFKSMNIQNKKDNSLLFFEKMAEDKLSAKRVTEFMVRNLESWNIVDKENNLKPITVENFEKLPTMYITQIFEGYCAKILHGDIDDINFS